MKSEILRLLAIATLFFTLATALPFTFTSAHTDSAFRFKLEAEPNAEFFLFSRRFVSSPDHWTRVRAIANDLTVEPRFERENVLYNQKHEGRYHLAYHEEVDPQELKTSTRHLHYVNSRVEGELVGLLLPSFASELRQMRIDRLFRCSNTLVSVEWVGDDAYVVALSASGRWNLIENIDSGFIDEERGIQYGQAVDRGHVHPVQLQVGHEGKYCSISKDTKPAQIQFDWSQESYSIDQLLILVGESLPLFNKKRATYHDQL